MPFFDELKPGSGLPTIAAGAGAGGSPTVTLVTGSDDTRGQLSVLTGSSPTTSAVIATITLHAPLVLAPFVQLTPANAPAEILAAATPFVTSTTTTFVINSGTTGLTATTTYLFNYRVN